MTTDSAHADNSPGASRSPALPGWPWRRGALLLAGAAQLISISALGSADPFATHWPSLPALAAAPFAAAAAFSPAPANMVPAVAGTGGPDGTVLADHGRWDIEKTAGPGKEMKFRAFGNGQYWERFMLTPRPGSRPSRQASLVASRSPARQDARSQPGRPPRRPI